MPRLQRVILEKKTTIKIYFPNREDIHEFAIAFQNRFIDPKNPADNTSVLVSRDFQPDRWYVGVTFPVYCENEFYRFFRDFCRERKIPIDDDQLQPGPFGN